MSCVSKVEILYSCIHSDHHPVLFCLDSDIVPECNTSGEAGNTTKLKVHWNNIYALIRFMNILNVLT